MMENTPYIHCFKTSQSHYMYDVNTDEILEIPEFLYRELKEDVTLNHASAQSVDYAQKLKQYGFMKTDRVEKTEHPMTMFLADILKRKVMQVILQVTQRCNLRCDCIYSGIYKNRVHSQKDMNWETAQKAMDLLISHSSDSEMLSVSFYGGEPLLRLHGSGRRQASGVCDRSRRVKRFDEHELIQGKGIRRFMPFLHSDRLR